MKTFISKKYFEKLKNYFHQKILQCAFLCIVIFCLWGCGDSYNSGIQVIQVYDGDTVKLANGEKVRLIGIDCPEEWESEKLYWDTKRLGQDIEVIKAMGKEAGAFTQNLVLNKKVRLEFDVEKRDKYNRLLAYLYLPDGKFVNETIIKEGYAYPLMIPPNLKYTDYFMQLYREARAKGRGLWKKDVI